MENVKMSSCESSLYRCNSLNSINLVHHNNQSKTHTLSRSNSIDSSTVPDLLASNPYKVFSRLKEHWDIEKLEKNIKHRIHLATIAGVVNLRKMQLKTIPDDIFYLEMDTEEKVKVKEEEEIMLLQEDKIKKTIFQEKMAIGRTATISAKLEKNTEFIVDQFATPLSFESIKKREDNFQFFLDSYLPGYEYDSYGEIIKAYLKQRVTKYIQKTLLDSIPLIKGDLNKSVEILQEPKIMENASIYSVETPERTATPTELSNLLTFNQTASGLKTKNIEKIETEYGSQAIITVPHQATTVSISKIPIKTGKHKSSHTRSLVHKCTESGLNVKDTEKLHKQYKSRLTTTESAQFTGSISKIPVKFPQQRTVYTKILKHKHVESSLKLKDTEKTDPVYRNQPMTAVSAQIKIGTISKIPLKTKQQTTVTTMASLHTHPVSCSLRKGEIKYTGLQMKTGSPSLTIGMSRTAPVKGSIIKRIIKLPELPKDRNTSTGIERKSVVPEISVAAGDSPAKFFAQENQEYCFLLGYSLIGVNPYTGEQICVLQDVHDTVEIKSRVSSFFHDLTSEKETQKLQEEPEPITKIMPSLKSRPEVPTTFLKSFSEAGTAFQRKSECVKHIHTKLKCKNTDSDITKTLTKVAHADLKDVKLQRSASKIPRSKASTDALASLKSSLGRTDVVQSKSLKSDMSTSYTDSTSNDTGSCSGFENTPEKYIFFRGDTLIYENPLTGEEFCIFKNIKDINEIKKVVTEVLMSCACERKDTVTSIPSTKDIHASPDIVFNPITASEIAVMKLPEHSEEVLLMNVPVQNTDIRQVKERPRTNTTFVSTVTAPIEKATNVVSKLVSKNKISQLSRNKTSMSSTKARGEQLPHSKVVSSSNIFISEPASEHVLGGVQTKTDTKYENNDISVGMATYASDSLCEESDIGYSLIKETYLERGMKPLAASTPKNLSLDSGKKDEQCDSVSQIQRIIKDPHGSKQQSSIQRKSPVKFGMVRTKSRELQLVHDVKLKRRKRKPINALILDNNEIEEISCKIGYLTNLTTIYFENNMLTVIPNEIRKLQKLEKLHLDNNRIATLPAGLFYLTSLKYLSVKGNKLIHVSILLRYLDNLQFLDISCNYLTELPKDIYKLKNLRHLAISRNQIKSLPEIFPVNLREFFANGNEIARLPNLLSLKKLRILSVHSNKLTELPCLASSIKKIYASQNFIFDLKESLIENWSELETLNLCQNQLFRLPENIHMLLSLRKLRLSHNKIYSLPRALSNISYLEELDLNMNPLSATLTI